MEEEREADDRVDAAQSPGEASQPSPGCSTVPEGQRRAGGSTLLLFIHEDKDYWQVVNREDQDSGKGRQRLHARGFYFFLFFFFFTSFSLKPVQLLSLSIFHLFLTGRPPIFLRSSLPPFPPTLRKRLYISETTVGEYITGGVRKRRKVGGDAGAKN